jgi:EpsD family peptidyl-prolyl cis-trans isomerase
MKIRIVSTLAVIACLGVSSCDKLGGNSRPTGQVVAKVGKDEITVLDLQAELNGYKAPDARAQKVAEQSALKAIIQRKIIAAQARKEKLDKTPEFAQQQSRTTDLLLVKDWQDRLVKAVPPPNLDEVRTFIAQHPDMYSQRKRLAVEGLRFAFDPNLSEVLKPLNTLEEVEAVLTERKIAFQRGNSEIDALAVDPRFMAQLLKLPSGTLFVVPQGNAALVARIREIKVDPVPDNLAVRHATEFLRRQRVQEAVGRQANGVLAAAQTSVKYNNAKGSAPTAPAAAPAAAPAPVAPAGKP